METENIERREIERIAKEFYKLVKDLSIELTIRSKKTILSIAKSIITEKNLKIEPTDLSLKGKCITYCPELPFEIFSPCSYLNIETMNIISSSDKNKKYYVSLVIKLSD